MSIVKEKYGVLQGREVYMFTLSNENGLTAKILNYGGIVTNLIFDGIDVIYGMDTFEDYLKNDAYFGALIGRNANRIEYGTFNLNGKTYTLNINDGPNNHHGGTVGFDKKIWDALSVDGKEPSLVLTLTSPDGDEGFPGNVDIRVTYTITADNALSIHYEGTTDADTILNMTSHCYFNMNGHASGSVDNHTLWLDSDFYAPITHEGVPTGEVLSSEGTPFKFTGNDTLKSHLDSDHMQIAASGGIDHGFAINGFGYRHFGTITGDKTGITMEMYTDEKAVQIYTYNNIDSQRRCKGGNIYATHGAICFETHHFPSSLKFSHFPSAVLKKGEKYDTTTAYKFKK